ncbi:hypothetical protein LZ30DRAFT_773501 [Colletotrichum cereale]|nr:hypothetical protein LZ30DRAFT_773501 [Colletotrichum cereale]
MWRCDGVFSGRGTEETAFTRSWKRHWNEWMMRQAPHAIHTPLPVDSYWLKFADTLICSESDLGCPQCLGCRSRDKPSEQTAGAAARNGFHEGGPHRMCALLPIFDLAVDLRSISRSTYDRACLLYHRITVTGQNDYKAWVDMGRKGIEGVLVDIPNPFSCIVQLRNPVFGPLFASWVVATIWWNHFVGREVLTGSMLQEASVGRNSTSSENLQRKVPVQPDDVSTPGELLELCKAVESDQEKLKQDEFG